MENTESARPATQRRARRSAWELRPGDIPAGWWTRRDPRLEGLESNPVFRSHCAFQRKLNHNDLVGFASAWIGMAIALYCFNRAAGSPDPFLRGFVAVALTIGAQWVFLAFPFGGQLGIAELGGGKFFKLSPSATFDFILAGYPLERICAGAWGFSLRRRVWLFHLVSYALLWAAGAVLFLLPPGPLRYFWLPMYFMGAFWAGLTAFAPWHTLPGLRFNFGAQRRQLRLIGYPQMAMFMLILLLASFVCGASMAAGTFHLFGVRSASWAGMHDAALGFLASPRAAMLAAAAGGSTGAALGGASFLARRSLIAGIERIAGEALALWEARFLASRPEASRVAKKD